MSSFWIALSIGFLIQGYKGIAGFLRERRWNIKRFVETGGMPSSHSAAVSALSVAVGLTQGFRTTLFAVTLFFSLIVMYDAAGLRRAAGRQAAILNRLIAEHYSPKELRERRLMELLGHTPFEVLVGALLGVLYALIWHWIL
jgi:acid phosphatase family membrane protein YuiD